MKEKLLALFAVISFVGKVILGCLVVAGPRTELLASMSIGGLVGLLFGILSYFFLWR
ncbi:MAG: hypothetical protein ACOYBJ_03435 [Patescibacteria group bacterium]